MARWGALARKAVGDCRKLMCGAGAAAPTMCSASSQRLYVWRDGVCAALAVEERALMLGVDLDWLPLRVELLGSCGQGGREAQLSTTAAWSALGDGMHCSAVAAVLRVAWAMVRSVFRPRMVVRVHSSCAGLVNAFFRSAVRVFGGAAKLMVATELSGKRRRSLARQYPGASLFAQATDGSAFLTHCDVIGVSWPCQFYSTAGPAVG